MINKQWLIWRFIEMPPEKLAHMLDLEWFCENYCDDVTSYACDERCRKHMIDWLEKERESNEIEK